ncbi:PhoP regulatory network YrbL family protein [Vibrio splendidus]|jgi:hypothetical protein|uniref:YrbL family protein n=1 Tax=Vibrio splendidus TaxID=29497 RepID=UPI001FB27456|nr:YrbL family protein [Vibrio splendidus]UOE80953.1 PhoP regulatory network YrbL family protein [Vibrio splendidus]
MIHLDKSLYLASGEMRDVFLHPSNKKQCIKVEKTKALCSNKLEARFLEKYKNCQYLPECYGFHETNFGSGLVVEIIYDFDSKVSRSLEYYLETGELSPTDGSYYTSLVEAEFLSHNVLIHDDGLQNILLKRNRDQSFSPVMIDGLGPREMDRKTIFKVLFPFLARQKSRKVFGKMNKKINKYPV